MCNQPKPHNCGPHQRIRVLLDEAEIQRRMSRPKRPTLAERYAGATDVAQRERFYADENRRSTAPPPSPRPPAPKVWVTQPILRVRGWTDTAIRNFLPKPEHYRPNPHVPMCRPMPLWSTDTIARAEATAAWRRWLRTSLRRRRLTLHDLASSARGSEFRRRVETVHAAITAYQGADVGRRRPTIR
jgi:hypothetical protein